MGLVGIIGRSQDKSQQHLTFTKNLIQFKSIKSDRMLSSERSLPLRPAWLRSLPMRHKLRKIFHIE